LQTIIEVSPWDSLTNPPEIFSVSIQGLVDEFVLPDITIVWRLRKEQSLANGTLP